MLLFDYVLDLELRMAAGLESHRDGLAILVQVNVGDGIAHVTVDAVDPVEAEGDCTDCVVPRPWGEEVIKDDCASYSEEVLDSGLLHFVRDETRGVRGGVLGKDCGLAVGEGNWANGGVENVVVELLVGS